MISAKLHKCLLTATICAIAVFCMALVRSSDWRDVRNSVVVEHPYCALCGAEKELEAHHIVPFHINPSLELATNNLAILCRSCHYQLGHGGISWSYENTNITKVLQYDTGGQLYRQRVEYKEALKWQK